MLAKFHWVFFVPVHVHLSRCPPPIEGGWTDISAWGWTKWTRWTNLIRCPPCRRALVGAGVDQVAAFQQVGQCAVEGALRHVGHEAKLGLACPGLAKWWTKVDKVGLRDQFVHPPVDSFLEITQDSVPTIGSMTNWWRSNSGPSLRFSRSRVMTAPSRQVK